MLAQQPAEREVEQLVPALDGEGFQSFDPLEVLLRQNLAGAGAFGEAALSLAVWPVLAGQEAGFEREVWDHAQPEGSAGGNDFALDAADE